LNPDAKVKDTPFLALVLALE